MYQHVAIILLVTHLSHSLASPDSKEQEKEKEKEKEVGAVKLGRTAECRADVTVLQQLCGLEEADLDNNWAILDCIDHLPEEKRLSDSCENAVWNFKLEITKKDYFLKQAKEICPNDDISKCEREENSEPGYLLVCLVNMKHETKNLQCGKFLGQVRTVIVREFSEGISFRWRASSSVTTGSSPAS